MEYEIRRERMDYEVGKTLERHEATLEYILEILKENKLLPKEKKT